MQTREDGTNFQPPYRVVAILEGRQEALKVGFNCMDDAGIHMQKIRAGDVKVRKDFANAPLKVEDTEGYMVYSIPANSQV